MSNTWREDVTLTWLKHLLPATVTLSVYRRAHCGNFARAMNLSWCKVKTGNIVYKTAYKNSSVCWKPHWTIWSLYASSNVTKYNLSHIHTGFRIPYGDFWNVPPLVHLHICLTKDNIGLVDNRFVDLPQWYVQCHRFPVCKSSIPLSTRGELRKSSQNSFQNIPCVFNTAKTRT